MDKSSPVRTCIVTSQEKSKEEMIRFVADPGGNILPDITGKLPGRGVWVIATRNAVAEAARKNLFARSLKQKTKPEAELAAQTETLLKKRVLDLLSLANKSGVLVSGFSKSMEALTSRKAALWFDAKDGGDADFEKLSRLPHGLSPSRDFTRTELGRPVGRADAVHVVVMTSGIAGEILKEMRRFAGFREIDTL
ncbi:MAG: RNA-binding protein [Rickettsiales bacterium]